LVESHFVQSSSNQRVYAIFDPVVLDEHADLVTGEIQSLGPEEEPDDYPYVAIVSNDSLASWAGLRRKMPWGILAGGHVEFDGAVEHLRSVLEWRDHENDPIVVRLFDETVLSPFLEVCDETERYWTFGPFDWFARPVPGTGWLRLTYMRPPRSTVGERNLMLRNEHYEAFAQLSDSILVDNLIDHLQDEHLGLVEDLEREDLETMVTSGVARARAYGFESVDDLGAFVAMMFEVAPNFDAHPQISAELANPEHEGPERWLAILEAVSETAWEEAERAYDEAAWFIGEKQ
jgi:hypothetical protein